MLDKIKNNYILLISLFLIIYFVSNLIGGERGLFSFFKKKNDLNHLIAEKDKLLNEIENCDADHTILSIASFVFALTTLGSFFGR